MIRIFHSQQRTKTNRFLLLKQGRTEQFFLYLFLSQQHHKGPDPDNDPYT